MYSLSSSLIHVTVEQGVLVSEIVSNCNWFLYQQLNSNKELYWDMLYLDLFLSDACVGMGENCGILVLSYCC